MTRILYQIRLYYKINNQFHHHILLRTEDPKSVINFLSQFDEHEHVFYIMEKTLSKHYPDKLVMSRMTNGKTWLDEWRYG